MGKQFRTKSEQILRRIIGTAIETLLERDTVSYTTSITAEADGIKPGWDMELQGVRQEDPDSIRLEFYRFPHDPTDPDILTAKWMDIWIVNNEPMADLITSEVIRNLQDGETEEEQSDDSERCIM